MGSGSESRAVGDPNADPSSGEMGELSSMISWVERVLDTLVLMASAGVAKGTLAWVADGDGLGVGAANRGVAWNWLDPRGY
jgi:hypothetical protein